MLTQPHGISINKEDNVFQCQRKWLYPILSASSDKLRPVTQREERQIGKKGGGGKKSPSQV